MYRIPVGTSWLASNITKFAYDLQRGNPFDGWFSRYVDLFEKDTSMLDNAAKVWLLLRKLNPGAHERYTSFILASMKQIPNWEPFLVVRYHRGRDRARVCVILQKIQSCTNRCNGESGKNTWFSDNDRSARSKKDKQALWFTDFFSEPRQIGHFL